MNAVLRFWSKVDVRGPDECWEWTGSFRGPEYRSAGYGQFYAGKGTKVIGAHRFAAMLRYGMFDRRLFVCHSCDNTRCVNPSHLFLGTHQDNVNDMVAKGRQAKVGGERHPAAKLTDAQVDDIRRRYVRGHRFRPGNRDELAAEYGIHPRYVLNLCRGERRTSRWP